MSRANFVQIPNLSDDTINRLQGNIAKAFANVDTPSALVIKTVRSQYLVSADDDVVLCDPSAGAFDVVLPALGKLTKPVSVRLTASGATVTVRPPAGVTVDGAPSLTLTIMPVRLVSNAQGYWSA